MTVADPVRTEARDRTLVVTIDRPAARNAIDGPTATALFDVFTAFDADDAYDVAVLTGADGAFCSGADLSDASGERRHQLAAMRRINAVIQAWHELPQPTIAKVTGVAAGVGLSLALGCDLVVATEEARFSEIFAKRGLSIDFGGSWLLPRLIGLHRAKELAFFGDIVGAADAERLGLVNRVVPDAELDAFVADWAERLAAGASVALAQTKRLLNESMQHSLAEALDAEGVGQLLSVGTEDAKEAEKAFLAKREPSFHGR